MNAMVNKIKPTRCPAITSPLMFLQANMGHIIPGAGAESDSVEKTPPGGTGGSR